MARLAVLTVVLTLLVASTAAAQDRHSTTHALWLGGRFDPGAAWNVGYDLEVELDTPCGFNLGPSVAVAFGGGDGGAERQDLLVSLDLLRGRFLLDESSCGSCGYRLQALLGAGGYLVINPALPDPSLGSKTNVLEPDAWRFGAQVTGGLSADWWMERTWGFTGLLAFHVRLDDWSRMPAIWAEAGLGLRFGT